LYGSAESCEMLMDALERFELKKHASIRGCVAFILAKNKNKRTSIHEAARAGNVALLQLFFRLIHADTLSDEFDEHKRAFCDDTDDEFKTSLHLCAAAGEFPSM
jgi:ankyrin repeat protein